jgi:hypothetical protein
MIYVPTIGGPPIEVRLSKVLVDLNNKRSIKKYADAIPQVRAATTPDEITQILRSNSINYKNGNMMGGKRTKKIRKQKGGFVYRANTKRKSLSSNSKRRIRSRSSSRKSNKRSF